LQKRNVGLFYFLEAILSLSGGIILPVYVLYFRLYDISLFQIALLATIFEATIIVFEMPTGYFADKYGRKLSTLCGFFLYCASALIFFTFRDLPGFIIAEIIFGIAETFISGALEALAVDSIRENEKDGRLSRLFANRAVFKTSALLFGMVAAGVLAKFSLELLFIPVIILNAGGVGAALFLIEPKKGGSPSRKTGEELKAVKTAIFKNKSILALFAVGILANFAYEPVDQYWQVLFSEIRKFDVAYFGLLTSAGLILVVFFAKPLEKVYGKIRLYITACYLIIAVAILMTVVFPGYPAIVGIISYFALKELVRPAISTRLNRLSQSAFRATFLSGYNLACSIGEVVAGLSAGLLASAMGIKFVFFFSAVSAMAVWIVYLAVDISSGSSQNVKASEHPLF
jgi:DHA3 family tetracycline resistance protein-like MFS transporter